MRCELASVRCCAYEDDLGLVLLAQIRECFGIRVRGEMTVALPFDHVCPIGTIPTCHLERFICIVCDDDRPHFLTDLIRESACLPQKLCTYLFPFELFQEDPNIAMIVLFHL